MSSKTPEIQNIAGLYPPSIPSCISFNPKNDNLAVGTKENGVLIYDIKTSEIINKIDIKDKIIVTS